MVFNRNTSRHLNATNICLQWFDSEVYTCIHLQYVHFRILHTCTRWNNARGHLLKGYELIFSNQPRLYQQHRDAIIGWSMWQFRAGPHSCEAISMSLEEWDFLTTRWDTFYYICHGIPSFHRELSLSLYSTRTVESRYLESIWIKNTFWLLSPTIIWPWRLFYKSKLPEVQMNMHFG